MSKNPISAKTKTHVSLRSSWMAGGLAPEWDVNSKEPWHFEFEKEPLNDEKWSCIVTAAVPSEVQDQECIQIYNQCLNIGLRKAIKIITMADVMKLLKENNDSKSNIKNKASNANVKNAKSKREKTKLGEQQSPEKSESSLKPPTSNFTQIVSLAAKYAMFTDIECMLPADLMAGLIKYLILNLKSENCLKKKIDAVEERKIRERNIKAKFIRDLKPYEMSQEETKFNSNSAENILDLKEPINDEPIEGPDLYVMLVDFYDLYIFPELERMNVPFVAIFEVSTLGMSGLMKDSSTFSQKSDIFGKRKPLIQAFWEKFKEECSTSDKAVNFKNIATIQYQLTVKPIESKLNFYRVIFDELSWMQYSAFCIYRQHQKYLQELYVQRLYLSLEPLDLSKCMIYNKLCDALITGEPLTPLLVLYAIIEQVVAGVPETNSVVLDYQPPPGDFFSDGSEDVKSFKEGKKQIVGLVTPCLKCRDKKCENICEKLKEDVREIGSSDYGERSQIIEENNESSTLSDKQIEQNFTPEEKDETSLLSTTYNIPETLLDRALSEKKTEKDMRKEKKWKTPRLCFHGDSVFFQTYHCTPRLVDTEFLVDRFLKNTDLPRLWIKYPELSPGDKAFYNFHFDFLKKISKESEDFLKLKIFFAMSMKLTGIAKSYLYRGEEEGISDVIFGGGKEKIKKLSKVKFNKDVCSTSEIKNNFSNYFYKTFIRDVPYTEPKKTVIKIDSENIKSSTVKTDSELLHKVKSQFDMAPPDRSSEASHSWYLKDFEKTQNNSWTTHQNSDKELLILFSLLDCLEISNLTQPHLINDKENFLNLIQSFKFYEKFEPHVMIQKLVEAQENFNMTQCSYFPLTDTVIIIMYNDFDHRGIFYMTISKTLPTPVTFRDFYSRVYQDINYWLTQEVKDHKKFVTELEEKARAEREKKDSEYLAQLKRHYCQMSDEEKKEFLETDLETQSEFIITETELKDLPNKPKPPFPNKISFVTTNFMDLSVEVSSKIHEFHSQDGTEVNVKIENWLYAPSSLLRLKVKRSSSQLYYYQELGQEEIGTSFTFKTASGIIFSFYKSDSEDAFNYDVTTSWPTGLLIRPVFRDSRVYVKQSYIKTYRKGWDIEEETSRCFLKNGQVLIFKDYGGFDILCASGTKYTFVDSVAIPKYEIISPTGEVWEIQTKGRCKNRKNLFATLKVFIGVDPNTQETFYKREDGVYCMLWPNGILVTTYPDGTKITTIPEFDDNEVSVEYTEEEKLYLKKHQSKFKSEGPVENRSAIIKSSLTLSERKSYDNESNKNDKFVTVSCSYLLEHPKYSSIYFNSEEDRIRVKMPEDLLMFIYPEGNYQIQKDSNFLKVFGSTVEFYTDDCDCKNRSCVTLNLDENEILCKCVDFFDKVFFLLRNGKTGYEEASEASEDVETAESGLEKKPSSKVFKPCLKNHNKSLALTQRCFAFERDLSGVEFLHEDSFAFYSDKLPEDTFFEINADDPSNLTHTFSSPYYKVGYESWVMDYEDKDNALPTNLKKKDLKEMGVKEVSKNLFKYPFPPRYNCGDRHQTEKPKPKIDMPKLIMARTIRGWPQDPNSVIYGLQKNIALYQKTAHDIWKEYKNHKVVDYRSHDYRYVKMRLRKIALTLSQSLQMYPHLCTQFPSTEKEIHYFGHFINSMADMKHHSQDSDKFPDCKQTPIPLPRSCGFPSICEESESPESTWG